MTDFDDAWRKYAACLGKAPLWDQTIDDDHTETNAARKARWNAAKAICARCPVGAECLADAVLGHDEGIRFGVNLRPVNDRHKDRKKWAS